MEWTEPLEASTGFLELNFRSDDIDDVQPVFDELYAIARHDVQSQYLGTIELPIAIDRVPIGHAGHEVGDEAFWRVAVALAVFGRHLLEMFQIVGTECGDDALRLDCVGGAVQWIVDPFEEKRTHLVRCSERLCGHLHASIRRFDTLSFE